MTMNATTCSQASSWVALGCYAPVERVFKRNVLIARCLVEFKSCAASRYLTRHHRQMLSATELIPTSVCGAHQKQFGVVLFNVSDLHNSS